jgi:mRNA-degrading endonuclease RelE of RelBE toxin-antitoxin system
VTYDVFVEQQVHQARARLPGNVRQRIRRLIGELGHEPRPAGSALLDVMGLELPPAIEARRYRLDPWRLVYAVNDEARWVWVLAIRRRPPYDYEDLADLVARLR